ncbi:hypothetical protein UFOVP1007_26 [uncultured Caudovirales phage]|uniref:Uncharacterized protein n=1 Tax=uncultured Caudovirales phage TaxID=2100421 RepID=A0A6J5PS67_9CAUD|nr:hypothetical protein UFOVP927_37 [uncultured Caudovirales phage]CAB4178131.1 hypothetical protein UFOVP1007_26 [uncultured Caudovirales phage]CAB4187403.1 hypothetical protein UFOVP1159_26 [uncultured Caudovirales phage]
MPYTPSVQDRTGEILAQGFSSLVQGVESYNKKKEEKEILDSTVTSLMSRASTSPKLAQFLGVNMSDAKAVEAGIKAAGGGDAMAGARALRQSLQQFGEFERQEKEREDDNTAFGIGMKAFGGGTDPFAAGAQAGVKYSPRVAKALSDLTTGRALEEERRATALERRAEAARGPKPENLTFQERAVVAERAAQESSLGRKLTPSEDSAIYKDVAQRSNPAGDPDVAARTGMLAKELPLTGERGDVALRFLPTLTSLSGKLDKGLKTGKLEDFRASVVGYAKGLGIPVDEAALGSAEAAQAQFGSFLLQAIAQTKGAISERENTLFAAMGPQFAKSPAANKELLGMLKAQTDLDIELGNIYRVGISGDSKLSAIAAKQQAARNKFAKKYDDMLSKAEASFGVTYEDKIKAAIGN